MLVNDFIHRHRVLHWSLVVLGIWIVSFILLVLIYRPSHDRNWELGHEQLPYFIFSKESSEVTINNFRDFYWTDVMAADANYMQRTFDLDSINGVDVFISHFDEFEGLAHIFLSFTLEDDNPIVVSVETRRESDESFSPLLGILRQFEIIYVVGSEEDVVGLRTGHRGERVYLYPTKVSSEQAKELFVTIINKVNDIYEYPRMYNTLTHNCTNELTRSVESVSSVDFPITWKTLMPGYFDEVLYDLGLIGGGDSFLEVKQNHLINNVDVDVDSGEYSESLRKNINNQL